MRAPGLIRLVVLAAAVGCVLVGLRILPALTTAGDLAPAPTVIVNDTSQAVVVVHCAPGCPPTGGTTLAPGRELQAGPARAVWQVRTASGELLGCVAGTAAGQRLPVSGAARCST